ncbi:MAG: hypothetical protein PHZ07_02085 [Patescibacteria group bacterium]|nr:hypothetical protein [Patescibacteria group bacterium]MDD4304027.1 hypothetical protein [Patescibacteria group bacterium]
MAKQEAEWSNSLKISWLKKHGYLNGGLQYGGIRWVSGINQNENSIGFIITINNKDNNIVLRYTQTNRDTKEKENMDYKIKLTTTQCNYGGKRYWFICPLIKNGKVCGRRVGVLFSIGKWFGCRHCGNIAYSSQMRGGKFRGSSLSSASIERAEKEVRRFYYNGKPTRKFKRLIKMREDFEQSFIMMVSRLDKSFGKFINIRK